MSNKVDTRVVRMEFDNAQFEKKVKQTTKSLDKLDQSMDFRDAGKGLDDVKLKISALEVTAVAAISNIATRVVNLGIQLVKSLSVDNLAAGWVKYGDKTTSVATMVTQTLRIAGKVIDDDAEKLKIINEQLELLNWFSDETSYSFNDMVSNVSKFTAAGQDLDASVKAMEGIATWAAMSGQNSQKASMAMYQLAQAMGAGVVKLQDWKSIQNVNMDTEVFREKVLETAVALGQLTKEGDEFVTKTGKKFKQNQFTVFLSEGWFTSDVLSQTLGKYSAAVEQIYEIAERTGKTASEVIEEYGDQLDEFGVKAFKAAQEARTFTDVLNSVKDAVSSKWMQTFEYVFGGQEDAVRLWTDLANELYEVFAESGNFRNNILAVWSSLGGRNDLFAKGGSSQGAFWNIYDAIKAVIDTIKGAWNTIFPLSEMEDENDQAEGIARSLKGISKEIQQFTVRLKNNTRVLDVISRVSKIVFSALKFGVNLIKLLRYALDPVIEITKQLISRIFDEVLYFIEKINANGSRLESFFTKIHDFLEEIVINLNLDGFLEALFTIIEKVFTIVSKLFTLLGKLTPVIKTVLNGIITVVKWITKLPGLLNDAVKNWTGRDILENISWFFDRIISLFEGFTKKEEKTINKSRMMAKKAAKVGNEAEGESSKEDAGVLTPLQILLNGIVAFSKGFLTMAKGALAGIGKALEWIGNLFNVIGENLNKVFTVKEYTTASQKAMKAVAIMLLILAATALIGTLLVNISWNILAWAAPINNMADALTDYADGFKRNSKANLIREVANAILKFAIGIALIGGINFDSTIKTLIFIGVTIGVLIGLLAFIGGEVKSLSVVSENFAQQIKGLKSGIVGAIESLKQTSLIGQFGYLIATFGNLLLKLAIVAKTFETIEWEDLAKTGLAVAAMVGSIILIGLTLGNKKNLDQIRGAYPGLFEMIAIVSIIHVLGKTMQSLVGIPWDSLWPALIGIMLIMATLTKLIVVIGLSRTNMKRSWKDSLAIFTAMGMIVAIIRTLTMSILALKDVSLGIVIAIMAGITALVTALSFLFLALSRIKVPKTNPVKKALKSITIIAGTILAISGALYLIGQLNGIQIDNAIKAIGAVTGIFAAFMVLTAILSKIFRKDSFAENIFAMALSLTVFTTALVPFAGAMMMLSGIGWDGLKIGLIAIASMIGIFAASSILLKKSVPFMAAFASVLIVFTTALVPFGAAMMMLASIGWDGLKIALLGFAGAIGIFAIASKLLKMSIPVMIALASAVGIIGISMLLAGIGMMAFANGIMMLGANIKPALQAFIDVFKETGPEFFESLGLSFTSFILGLITGIRKLIPQVVGLVKDLVISIAEMLRESGSLLISPVIYILEGLLAALAEHSLAISQSVMQIILSVLQVLDENFYEISSRIFSMLGQLLDAFADWIPEAVPILVKIIINLLEALVTALGPKLPYILSLLVIFLGQVVDAVLSNIIPFITLITKLILILLAYSLSLTTASLGTLAVILIRFVAGLLMLLKDIFIGMNDVLYELIKTVFFNVLQLLLKVVRESFEIIASVFTAVIRNLLVGVFKAILNMPAIGSAIKALIKLFGGDPDAIMNAADDWADAALDKTVVSGQNVNNAVTKASDNILNTISSTMDGIGDALTAGLQLISHINSETLGNISDSMDEFGENLGGNIGSGLAAGMIGSEDVVRDGSEYMTRQAIEAAEDEAEVNSPSRVFMRIGEYMAQGLAIGIQNGRDMLVDNITRVIDSTIGIAEDILSDTEDNDITLVVGLDTTNVESQAARVQDIMSGITNPDLSFYGRNADYNAKANKRGKDSGEIGTGSGEDNSTNVTYNNTFNISSTDPEESAEEIDKKLKEQSLRARYAKGLV